MSFWNSDFIIQYSCYSFLKFLLSNNLVSKPIMSSYSFGQGLFCVGFTVVWLVFFLWEPPVSLSLSLVLVIFYLLLKIFFIYFQDLSFLKTIWALPNILDPYFSLFSPHLIPRDGFRGWNQQILIKFRSIMYFLVSILLTIKQEHDISQLWLHVLALPVHLFFLF